MENPPNDPLGGLRSTPDPRDPRAPSLLREAADAADGAAVMLLGLPYDGGIPSRPGARFGPRAVREALGAYGTYAPEEPGPDGADLPAIRDLGDLALPTMNGADAHARIEEAAARAFADGRMPIFVGGDHGCTGSIIRGLAAARPGLRLALLSIDAHLDVREYDGEANLSSGTPFRRALETQVLDGSRIAMVGLRRFANSRYYLDWARAQGIRLHSVEEVGERGARSVARQALDAILADADALYLSIDMDAADAAFAPGVSAPGIGGLSAREMIDVVREAAGERRLIGADIMELSPPYDQDGRTARLAARLLLETVAGRSGSPE